MRRWTRRSLWSQPRRRRFARSLPAISSLARSARWRRISIGGGFAARRRGGCERRGRGGGAGGGGGGPDRAAAGRAVGGGVARAPSRRRDSRGEQVPIVDRALFAAVQAKLAAQARARRCRLRGSPALLSGRLFDNRGNRMSPTHANKGGARYRYYVSQAVLQNKPPPSGLVGRV